MTPPTRLCVASTFFCALLAVDVGLTAEPIDIGSRRELFVDDHLIARLEGAARLRLHHPVRRNLALVQGEAWEGNGGAYHTVFRDGEVYRMYYPGWQIAVGPRSEPAGKSHPAVICYAQSPDGIHWTKPNLGLKKYAGSKDNNIIVDDIQGHGVHGDFSPFKDPNPAATPDAKYKAIAWTEHVRGLFAFKSADAIHWEPLVEGPVITEEGRFFDTQNITFWSETEKRYILYYRQILGESRSFVRTIKRATSEDYIHWEKDGLLDFGPRPPTNAAQYYTNQILPYYRAPHIYVGFPARYVDRGWQQATSLLPGLEDRKLRGKGRYATAVTDSLLMVSRDGRRFHVWDEAFLRPGLKTRHNWAYGDNYMAWNVVETDSEFDDAPRELSLYATESYFTGTKSRLRRYTLRLDGFASAFAPGSGGGVVTKPIRFSGSELRLNFSTSAAGSIRVQIEDADGRALEGHALDDCEIIFGDATDQAVFWGEGRTLDDVAGKTVRLRFVLEDADVFAFRFVEAAGGQ
jgi:hypothetical protein